MRGICPGRREGVLQVTKDTSATADFVFALALYLFKLVHLCQISAASHRGVTLGAAFAAGSRP